MKGEPKSPLPFEFHGEHHSIVQGRVVNDTTAQFFGLSPAANSKLAWQQSRTFPLKLKPRQENDSSVTVDEPSSLHPEPNLGVDNNVSSVRALVWNWLTQLAAK